MKLITYNKFTKDEIIINPLHHPVDIFVLIKGTVSLSGSPPNQHEKMASIVDEMRLKMLNWEVNEPGDLFGDYSCFDPEKSWK